MKTALTIAGSDSCGGAGIQADIKTISALGGYAASAITAVTVQNTLGVRAVHAIPPEIVCGQIEAVMEDLQPVAIKIGMVNDIQIVHVIADCIRKYSPEHLPGTDGCPPKRYSCRSFFPCPDRTYHTGCRGGRRQISVCGFAGTEPAEISCFVNACTNKNYRLETDSAIFQRILKT